jgi:hypothetical protein
MGVVTGSNILASRHYELALQTAYANLGELAVHCCQTNSSL